ncbi:MAG: dockerin type I repeat-containing protein [Ruminococcus sp.]|nr:dockerin type I repeat-containing protein [Ruminococcus sp.]
MKKIVSVMITILTICSMCTLNADAYTYVDSWLFDGVMRTFTLYGYDTSKDLVIGDVNQDGEIDIEDVTLIQKYLADMTTPDTNQENWVRSIQIFDLLANVDKNPIDPISGEHSYAKNAINIKDATLIQRYLVKKDMTSDYNRIGTVHECQWLTPIYRIESNNEYIQIPNTSIKYYDLWSECSCGIQWHYKKAKCYCKGDRHDYDNMCFYDVDKYILDNLYYPHWKEEWDKIYEKLDEMEANGASEDDMIGWLETVDSHARASFCEYDHTGPDTKTIHHEAETVEVLDHYECKECGQTK